MTITVTTDGIVVADIVTNPTLSTILTNVSNEIGVAAPETFVGNTDQTAKELLHFARIAAEEITRRHDWGALLSSNEFVGTGANADFTLTNSFLRLTQGSAVTVSGSPLRGGLTDDEWNTLPSSVGTPKYFRIRNNVINFYPYADVTDTVTVQFISRYFTVDNLDYFTADDDRFAIPYQLVEKGIICRWLRHKGEPYEDHLAEFEAMFRDYADFDRSERSPA